MEQSPSLNVLGLLGKQLKIKSATIKIVMKRGKRPGGETRIIPKVRIMIKDFEFQENEKWNVQVPPNLRSIEADETIKPLLLLRVALQARIQLFDKFQSKPDELKLAPFAAFLPDKLPRQSIEMLKRENTGSYSKLALSLSGEKPVLSGPFLSVGSSHSKTI